MSDSLSSLRSAAGQAFGYIDIATNWTFKAASSVYNAGVYFVDNKVKDNPMLGSLFPQPNEDSASAFARGAKVGISIMLTGAAAVFAIKIATIVAAAIVKNVVVGCAAGGIFGLTQNFLCNRMNSQGPTHAALNTAQQNGGQQALESRYINSNV